MKIKFNKYERVAGLFVLTSVVGVMLILIGVAVKQGWFEAKIRFKTTFESADGLRVGTPVQISGLRAGSIIEVELRSNDEVHVIFQVSEKYHDLIREDSSVRTIRPFIISEKVLDIAIGSKDLNQLAADSTMKAEPSYDIMDLVSGRSLGPHLANMGKMLESLRLVAEALLNPERSQAFISMFDELVPMMTNMSAMSKEMVVVMKHANKDKRMLHTIDAFATMAKEMNRILPEVAKMMPAVAEDTPKITQDMAKVAANMAELTTELQKTMPYVKQAFSELGPELPRASRRAVEALDETVVTLKALQKSFLLRSNAREVREEEAADNQRFPAAEKRAP